MKSVKPTAITEWFRKSEIPVPGHFNQSQIFRCAKRLNPYTLKATMRMLCGYHENLRAVWDGNQLVVRDMNCLNLVLVEQHDLRRSQNVEADMLPILQKLQSSIDLAKGPLVHVGHFMLPEYDAVFMAIHHLVVDGVSWRIIAEDLNAIYPQLLTGSSKIKLPKIRCTFADYAEAVHQYAVSDSLAEELPYWTGVAAGIRELVAGEQQRSDEHGVIRISVDKEVTQKVLTECVGKYGVEINDLLLTALSRAWKKVSGQDKIALSMEGHGRESFGDNPLELERIIGWFTTIFPALVDGSIDDIAEHVKQTAATMHAIPNKGFGYGTLRHIAKKEEELACSPQMTFNYLGSFEEGGSSDQFFSFENSLPKGSDVDIKNLREEIPMAINCLVVKGCLVGNMSFDTGFISSEKAQALIDEFAAQLANL